MTFQCTVSGRSGLLRRGVAQDLEERDFHVVSQTAEPLPPVVADVHVVLLEDAGQLPPVDRAGGVVVLLRAATEDARAYACSVGASAALDVDTEPDEVAEVVRVVARGHCVVPTACEVMPPPAPLWWLTARQQEVLGALRSGRTQEAAARHLDISPGTVKEHLRQSRRRVGVSTTCQLLVWFERALCAARVQSPAVPDEGARPKPGGAALLRRHHSARSAAGAPSEHGQRGSDRPPPGPPPTLTIGRAAAGLGAAG